MMDGPLPVVSQLALVPQFKIIAVLPKVMPLLSPAIARSEGLWEDYDVAAALLAGHMHLWVSLRNDEIEAAMVTRFVDYPRIRVLSIPFMGGRVRANWLGFEDEIMAFGRANGCRRAEGFFRRGWLRVLPHWFARWTYCWRAI